MTFKNHKQMTKQTTIVVIGALRVKEDHAMAITPENVPYDMSVDEDSDQPAHPRSLI